MWKDEWIFYASSSGSFSSVVMKYALQFSFKISNNEVKYEVLMIGLRLTKELEWRISKSSSICSSSLDKFEASMKLEADNSKIFAKSWRCRQPPEVWRSNKFSDWKVLKQMPSLISLPRARLTITSRSSSNIYRFKVLRNPRCFKSNISQVELMDPIIDYLIKEVLPSDPIQAHVIERQAPWYIILDGRLYKKSCSLPLLHCLRPFKVDYALQKLHEDIYGNHLRGRSLAYKLIWQEYCWCGN